MKKFIYVAVMAIAVVFASCTKADGFGNSEYYKNHSLDIDINAGTVNGKSYDNTTDKCWKIETKAKVMGISTVVISYDWGTEFTVVAANETAIAALAGISKSTYTMKEASEYDTYEKCTDANAAAN